MQALNAIARIVSGTGVRGIVLVASRLNAHHIRCLEKRKGAVEGLNREIHGNF